MWAVADAESSIYLSVQTPEVSIQRDLYWLLRDRRSMRGLSVANRKGDQSVSPFQIAIYFLRIHVIGFLSCGLIVIVVPFKKELRLADKKKYWERFVKALPNLRRFVERCLRPEEVRRLRGAFAEVLREECTRAISKYGT